MNKLHQGLAAEERAVEAYLSARDSRLIARNYRWKGGEIDLIFEDRVGGSVELVFVEVRTRAPSAWVSALESVDPPKRHRIERTAEVFLSRYRGTARTLRFDVLAWDGDGWAHVVNAWPA